jgi:hypothetical protein
MCQTLYHLYLRTCHAVMTNCQVTSGKKKRPFDQEKTLKLLKMRGSTNFNDAQIRFVEHAKVFCIRCKRLLSSPYIRIGRGAQ